MLLKHVLQAPGCKAACPFQEMGKNCRNRSKSFSKNLNTGSKTPCIWLNRTSVWEGHVEPKR
ncbi:hypothetical protein JCM12296A_50980 [Desulfosarcina cetonica]